MEVSRAKSIKESLRGIVEVYARDRNIILSGEHKRNLVEYLLPYTRLSLYIPSTHEIKALSKSTLPQEDHRKVEQLLSNSTAEIRKGIYFLFKVKNRIFNESLSRIKIESEENAFSAAKSASIGIYISWFREIANGRGEYLRKYITPGLLDIAHEIYTGGESYAYLNRLCNSEASDSVRVFYEVLKRHLEEYRHFIYSEPVDSLFCFYVRHSTRMKWLQRLCHISQEILSRDENESALVVGFAEKLKKSPWTHKLGCEIEEKYKKPLSDGLIKWMDQSSSDGIFIEEINNKYILIEKKVPHTISLESARKIVYIGEAKRLLPMLKQNTHLDLQHIPEDGIFNAKWVSQVFYEAQERMRQKLFVEYKVYDHIKSIRDIFFLFRSDFAYDLLRSLDSLEYSFDPSVVDEVLDRCFGVEISEFIDVIITSTGFSLVYKDVFPYNLVVRNIQDGLSAGFELFWNIRASVYGIHRMYEKNKKPSTYALVCKAGEIEYYYFEKVLKTLWNFKSLPEDILYSPQKISKKVEDVLYHLISACKETCTLSILQKIQELLHDCTNTDNISTISGLLHRITSE